MMQRRTLPLMGALLIVLALLSAPWSARAQEPVASRLKMSIGGFIKPEFIYHSTRAGGAPGFVAGSLAVIPQKNTLAGDNGMFMADAMESRFNFTLTAPDWRGLKSTGFFEFDWFADTPSAFRGGANGVLGGPAPARLSSRFSKASPASAMPSSGWKAKGWAGPGSSWSANSGVSSTNSPTITAQPSRSRGPAPCSRGCPRSV